MSEKTKNQQTVLHELKANFKIERSIDYAIYNMLVKNDQDMLSNKELIDVLKEFFDWVEKKNG